MAVEICVSLQRLTQHVGPDAPWRSPYQARVDLWQNGATARRAVTPTVQIRQSEGGYVNDTDRKE